MKNKGNIIIIVGLIIIIIGLLILNFHDRNNYETKCRSDNTSSSSKSSSNDDGRCKSSKYVVCLKNYVGLNAANVGEKGLSERHERFAHAGGYLYFSFKNEDGSYVDDKNEEELKQYMVIAQDYEPDTPIELTFKKDDDGYEYKTVESQSIERLTLTVKKINTND